MGGVGGFGALCDLKAAGYSGPYLCCDRWRGTKLRIAIDTGHLDTLGIDLVAMCVNDLVCQGVSLLFSIISHRPSIDVDQAAAIITVLRPAVQRREPRLSAGKPPRMPGCIMAAIFDLAGFAVGADERGQTCQMVSRKATFCLACLGRCIPTAIRWSEVVEVRALAGTRPAPLGPARWVGAADPDRLYANRSGCDPCGRRPRAGHITGGA